jgi:hypothetical protein
MRPEYENIIANTRFRVHALQRMFQRKIRKEAIFEVLISGEVLEEYPDDLPYPSRLIMGWYEGRPLHVVVAYDFEVRKEIVITAYEPDPDKWDHGLRRRKR